MELMSSKNGGEVKQNTTVRCSIWSTLQIRKNWQNWRNDWMDFTWNNQHPARPYWSTQKAHLKPKRRIQTTQTCNFTWTDARTHIGGQTGNTFVETGVISQASVGEYCTSVYKNRGRTSTMTLRTYLHSESHCESVSRSHSVGPAVELISIVFPSAWSAW